MDDISREFPADAGGGDRSGSRREGAGGSGQDAPHDDAAAHVLRSRGGSRADLPVDAGAADPEARRTALRSERGMMLAEGDPNEGAPSAAGDGDEISAADAAAALRAAEDTLEVEDDPEEVDGDDGLPPVPALEGPEAIARVVFVLLLTQRDGLSLLRLAQACDTTQKNVEQALEPLQALLDQSGLPVELSRTGETIKFLSKAETFPYLQRLRGVKKLEKLSPAALETLAVIAYRQPVMRAEIEAIRGVKAGPMLRTLLQHKLVRVTGRADVPGRPLQYGTTQHFLERFGLSSLQELPSVKEWKQLG